MCYLKVSVVVLLAAVSSTFAAPNPLNLEDIGRAARDFGQRARDFGQKALPAVRGVCGFVNGYQGYPPAFPQSPGFPQFAGFPQNPRYPQVPQYYPQYPSYPPQYPNNFNPVSAGFPASPNSPPINGQIPTGGSEQDDLNKGASSTNFINPEKVPPQIQDVFKNFDKLPELDESNLNAAINKRLIDWNNSHDNVI